MWLLHASVARTVAWLDFVFCARGVALFPATFVIAFCLFAACAIDEFASRMGIGSSPLTSVFQPALAYGQEFSSLDLSAPSVDESKKPSLETSLPAALRWVPQDADFFWGGFGIAQQQARFLESDLARRFAATKVWMSASELFLKEWKDRKSDLARAKAILDNPSARDVRKFLYEIASEELFLFVDGNFSKSLNLWKELLPELELVFDSQVSTERRADLVANWIDQRLPSLQLPTVVLGAKFSDRDAALTKIDEVEGLIRLGIAAVPDLRPFFRTLQRVEDARGNRLVWTIHRDVIPWDSIPETDLLDRESLQDLRRNLDGKSFQWTVGIVDDYFCLSFGGDSAWMNRLGGDANLSHHPEILRLAREADSLRAQATHPSAYTSMYYTSDPCVAGMQSLLLDGFFRKLSRGIILENLSNYGRESDTFEWLTSVMDDANWIDEKIATVVPRFRGIAQCGWMDDKGFESFRIDRNTAYVMNGDAPLQASASISQEPLLILNVRLAQHPEFFDVAKEIVRRLRMRLREATKLDDSGWDLSPVVDLHRRIEIAWPSVELFTEIWEKHLLTGWSGEHCFVVDSANVSVSGWLPSNLGSDKLLPMPEVAWVSGLRDSDAWGSGVAKVAEWIAVFIPRWKLTELAMDNKQGREATGSDTWILPIELPSGTARIAKNAQWAWIGVANELFNQFNKNESKSPVENKPDAMSSDFAWHPNSNGSLVTFARIDLGGWGEVVGAWLELFIEQVPVSDAGLLKIPGTKTGRLLEWTREDVRDFTREFDSLGVLMSWSWVGEGGSTYSRSTYRSDR